MRSQRSRILTIGRGVAALALGAALVSPLGSAAESRPADGWTARFAERYEFDTEPSSTPLASAHRGRDGEEDINVCGRPTGPRQVTCFARLRVDPRAMAARPAALGAAPSPAALIGDNGAYSPAYLRSAYGAPSSTRGAGKTVAVVEAYADPSAESDLARYRAHYGLPPCTTRNGCFSKIGPDVGGSYTGDWELETALDLDMVSAICPKCHLLLVEAPSPYLHEMGAAVEAAVAHGADVVSDSWGLGEFSTESDYQRFFRHGGVPIVFSSGDFGYAPGAQYPAASPDVVAVGGTTLYQRTSSGRRDATETAWGDSPPGHGSGSACAFFEPKPVRQADACPGRAVADISAVADPATPVWVYDSVPYNGTEVEWAQVGGTSAAAPIVAAMYALAGAPRSDRYQPTGFPYARPDAFNDITQGRSAHCGSNFCRAARGYDLPTGFGTPRRIRGFLPSLPHAPAHFRAGARLGTVTLAWDPPPLSGGSRISRYRVYRSDRGKKPIASLPPAARTFTDTGLVDGRAYTYSLVVQTAQGFSPAARVSTTPRALDRLVLSPATQEVRAGEAVSYSLEGFDAQGRSLGDEGAAAIFSIAPDGTCAGRTCSATRARPHAVWARLDGKVVRASLRVTGGTFDHLVITPNGESVKVGKLRAFKALAEDRYGNILANKTRSVVFSISPDGSCTRNVCSAAKAGTHAVSGILKSTQVSASGAGFSCAITAVGVQCWGENEWGEIAPRGELVPSPTSIRGLERGIVQVATSVDFSCALTNQTGVKCWGHNQGGRLGNASALSTFEPTDVVGLTQGVRAVTASGVGCAVTRVRGLKCWGTNWTGEVGDGTHGSLAHRWQPVDVVGMSSGVAAASGGGEFTCALLSAGTVKCWGRDWEGELGDGHVGDPQHDSSPVPVDVQQLSGVRQISSGGEFACALTEAGAVKCWGDNRFGELGNGTFENSALPVQVKGLTSGVVSIASGAFFACALTSAGAIKCWGQNDRGQLGNGTTIDSGVPVGGSQLREGMAAVSAGSLHTCGLTKTGIVKCWGENISAELGLGYRSEASAVPVTTPIGAAVAARLDVSR